VDEIPPGARKIVEVARRSIGIFNIGGEFFALRNRCPHMGAELCRGRIWGTVRASTPGSFDYTPDGAVLSCPHHGWEFQIRTGRSVCDPERLRSTTYPVDVDKGSNILAADTAGLLMNEDIPVQPDSGYLILDLRG
jgi:3-phenylpropionate/trans-cinnamate dioxygenase ferredoxin subunit